MVSIYCILIYSLYDSVINWLVSIENLTNQFSQINVNILSRNKHKYIFVKYHLPVFVIPLFKHLFSKLELGKVW